MAGRSVKRAPIKTPFIDRKEPSKPFNNWRTKFRQWLRLRDMNPDDEYAIRGKVGHQHQLIVVQLDLVPPVFGNPLPPTFFRRNGINRQERVVRQSAPIRPQPVHTRNVFNVILRHITW